MSNYWQDRQAASIQKLADKRIKEVDKRIRKYYLNAMNSTINSFESVYNKLLADMVEGKQPTPADLYKLDKYWEMQGQLRDKLHKMGAKMNVIYSKVFESLYKDVYDSINITGLRTFNTIDDGAISQIINSIWCADGKVWSEIIWEDLSLLQSTLEEGLVQTIVTGKKTTELKKVLQERFNVSYHRASTLVRTETAHITTEASKKRYQDYGIAKVQFWADPDERTCNHCGKLHAKIYPVSANVPIPAHPRCRCTLLPIIEGE